MRAVRALARSLRMKIYLVGGAVRDAVLKMPLTQDLDFVVEEGSALKMAQALAEKLQAGKPVLFTRFGTAQLVWKGWKIEFVDARKESYSDSRKPEVEPASLREDLLRRDFTINTLIKDLANGRIHDLLGIAFPDIKRRILRTPLDPGQTFRDDPLRMLRAVRLSLRLGFVIEQRTAEGIKNQAFLLKKKVSPERVKMELDAIMSSKNPVAGIELLEKLGLLEQILPEISRMKEIPQDKKDAPDLFLHTMKCLERLARTTQDLDERYAALFHDLGKVKTLKEEKGVVAFHGHEEEGEKMAKSILERMRAAHEQTEKVSFLVRWHMLPTQYTGDWSDAAVKRFIRRLGTHLKAVLRLARSDIYGLKNLEHNFWQLVNRIEKIDQAEVQAINSPLSGEEIMHYFNRGPGPWLGEIKKELVEAILEGEIKNTPEAALAYLQSRYGTGSFQSMPGERDHNDLSG